MIRGKGCGGIWTSSSTGATSMQGCQGQDAKSMGSRLWMCHGDAKARDSRSWWRGCWSRANLANESQNKKAETSQKIITKHQKPIQNSHKASFSHRKYEYLKKEFHKLGIKIRTSSVKWDYWQALLSRGDRRLCDYLIAVYKAGANLGAFKQTYKEFNMENKLPPSDYFALKNHDLDEILTWDFISLQPEKKSLISEYKRLLNDIK